MHACTYLCVGSMSSCTCPLCPLPFRQGLSLILEPFYFVFTFIKSCNLQVPEAHPPSYLSPIVPGFQMCVIHPASFIGTETLNSELRTSCLSNKVFYPLRYLPRAVLIFNLILFQILLWFIRSIYHLILKNKNIFIVKIHTIKAASWGLKDCEKSWKWSWNPARAPGLGFHKR